ncbi:hypothetical protein LZ32DRAFT_13701 [Colletotrichum eremochloae]|nr:hypothetical protein LZ32DRAFT_13701 [Colletotrichum eremochloae]
MWASETNRKVGPHRPTFGGERGQKPRVLRKERKKEKKKTRGVQDTRKTSDWNTHDGIQSQPGPVSSWDFSVQVCRRSSPLILLLAHRPMVRHHRPMSEVIHYLPSWISHIHYRGMVGGAFKLLAAWKSLFLFFLFLCWFAKTCVCVHGRGKKCLRRNEKEKPSIFSVRPDDG